MSETSGRMPTESEQRALDSLADAVNGLSDGLDGLDRQLSDLLSPAGDRPSLALVKEDGSEDPQQKTWTGTRLDWGAAAVVGDNVRFKPSPGCYVGWRVYSPRGQLLGTGALGRRTVIRKRDTLTLADIVLHIRSTGECS